MYMGLYSQSRTIQKPREPGAKKNWQRETKSKVATKAKNARQNANKRQSSNQKTILQESNSKEHTPRGDWKQKDFEGHDADALTGQGVKGKQRLKCRDTLTRRQGADEEGEEGGGTEEKTLTDRGRQTCKEEGEKTEEKLKGYKRTWTIKT